MEHSRLEKDSIAQPELWSVLLVLLPGRIDVGLYPPVPREEMLWRSFRLDASSSGSTLKALEEVIYDNPLLLSDFKRVECVADTGWNMLTPPQISAEQAEELAKEVWGDDDSGCRGELRDYHTGASNAVMQMAMEADVEAFLRRTFYNIRFTERKAGLCRYFFRQQPADSSCNLYVIIDDDRRLTIVATEGDKLQLANSFTFDSATDAAYYTLACATMLGWDLQQCVIWHRGAMKLQDSFLELLRRYVSSVKALPFPVMRYRVSKYIMNAPLDLLITGQCE